MDGDGNETAGIHLPDLAAALGTHAGWNVRDGERSGADGALGRWNGSFIPFARTRREREERDDPRPSLEERYASRDDYLGKIARAALALRARRLLLDEDLPRLLEAAAAREVR